MTKDLYYTIPQYFEERMNEHSNVSKVENESDEEFFLYRVLRAKLRDSVLVWLSDAYHFTDVDFVSRPARLEAGDYIVIAKPEGSGGASQHLVDSARIGVGRLADFMGALNSKQMWSYEPPSFEEKQARKKKWEARGVTN
jgi:hypothetical protein